ncbi:MAG TPA: NAD(P)-dependent oxidoreductase, partial [Flavobacteriaceae bacterium]|nr:NAD(P)-dependent oxidoreductase [Flavobacteriaceae bacterium]
MERNNLYPIFLKMHKLQVLIIGGGNVALEKLSFLLKSSPNANVQMVATFFRPETIALANKFDVDMITIAYDDSFLNKKDLVIAATDNLEV